METKHRVSTKVLSLFLSVLMAASVFSIALPGLAPKASAAAGVYEKLGQAFQVAFDAGHMSTSAWTGVTASAGRIVVADTTEKGFVYDIVKALDDVIVAESAAGGAYNHNTKLAAHIKDELGLNEYQAAFIDACLPADGDYAAFDGTTGQWNGTTADLESDANKMTMTLEVARMVREDFLQQNAFTDIDGYSSYDRQEKLLSIILDYDRCCREAIGKGAYVTKLFDIPAREKIGRAKSVPADEYAQVYERVRAEMEQQVADIAAQGGDN